MWFYALVSYLDFRRISSPNFQNSQGIGAMTNVQKASKLVAQPTPSDLYILRAKSGKTVDSV